MSTARRRQCHALVVGLAAVLLLGLLVPAASAASPEERRLAENRARVAEVRGQVEAAQGRRSSDAASLERAQEQLEIVLDAVGSAEQAVQRQQQTVDGAGERLAELQAQAEDSQRVMSQRAVELYTQGTAVPFEPLLAADTADEALERSSYVDVVTRSDRRTVEDVTATQITVEAQREVLQVEEATLDRVLEQQRELLAEAESLRQERSLALAASASLVGELQAQERHLEEESRELAALVRQATQPAPALRAPAPAAPAPVAPGPGAASTARAGEPSAPSGPGSAREDDAEGGGSDGGGSDDGDADDRGGDDGEVDNDAEAPAAEPVAVVSSGGWTRPTSGPITSPFGRRGGRQHEGIDIGAPSGTPIVAASGGRVAFAGRQGGYGNLILVDHGGGVVTAYAHQSRLAAAVGQSVSSGEVIGYVGSTGNSSGPHLHFEVRVGGAPRNPLNYIGG